jgi:hypothetical protein
MLSAVSFVKRAPVAAIKTGSGQCSAAVKAVVLWPTVFLTELSVAHCSAAACKQGKSIGWEFIKGW